MKSRVPRMRGMGSSRPSRSRSMRSASTGAYAAFHHTWTVVPGIAFAVGSAITTSGSSIGNTVLGFVHIPGWFIQGIDAVGFRGRLQTLASDLMQAGREAAPGSLVEVTLFGSLKYGLHSDVVFEVED